MATRRSVDLSTQLLVEFLADVSRRPDMPAAAAAAAERAAAALEAEVGAVLMPGLLRAVGFPEGRIPEAELTAVAGRRVDHIDVPGVGRCAVVAAPLGDDGSGHLVLARSGARFTAEESNLVRGMARTLHLVLSLLRTLDAERVMRARADAHAAENAALLHSLGERHELLEQLITIQQAICRREPLDRVLDDIVTGAHQLLRCDVATLYLVDPSRATGVAVTESRGLAAGADHDSWRAAAAALVTGTALLPAGNVIITPTAMAAVVRDGKTAAGALVVGSVSGQAAFTDAQKRTLVAFAEHVSLALTDASTLEDMRQANHDALTGLASRRLFMDRLQQSTAHAAREGTFVAVLFVDVDRFKMINDRFGHGAGDRVLTELARRLTSSLRPGDSAARLGGDEFAVLLQGITDTADVPAAAERILAELTPEVQLADRRIGVTVSIGVVTSDGRDAPDAESLLRDADIAMYEAKHTGAGRMAVYHPGMQARFHEWVER